MGTEQRVDRFSRLRGLGPFRLFVIAGLIGTLAIGGASLLASQRAGKSEAMADVRRLTEVVAKTVVEPSLSASLLAGDRDAIDRLDTIVVDQVLDDVTVRVKLWDQDGRIIYSDESRLIGEIYELDDEKTESLWSGGVVSEISSLTGEENRFETADRLLEVYLPVDGPDGRPLLYESYFAMSEVTDSASRIRAEFVPITLAALLLMEVLHLALAWDMKRRMRLAQADRERLLQRAIDSSDTERRRIASDLHDGVVQDLVAMAFTVSAAAETADHYGTELAGDLRAAAQGTRRTLHSVRSLLVDIYPPNLHEHGLEEALTDLLAPASTRGIRTQLEIEGDPDTNPDVMTLVYRVAQEAVRNILAHAEAESIDVTVRALPGELTLIVRDDGRGFTADDTGTEGHLGLRILADLAADAAAELAIESTPGVGTSVRLEVPR